MRVRSSTPTTTNYAAGVTYVEVENGAIKELHSSGLLFNYAMTYDVKSVGNQVPEFVFSDSHTAEYVLASLRVHKMLNKFEDSWTPEYFPEVEFEPLGSFIAAKYKD